MKKTLVLTSLGGLLYAGAANAAYTGLYYEQYTNAVHEAPPNSITYRLYATFDNDMDQLTGMGGTERSTMGWNWERPTRLRSSSSDASVERISPAS